MTFTRHQLVKEIDIKLDVCTYMAHETSLFAGDY